MCVTACAGSGARTDRDASLPQESTENATCDECGVRTADGLAPDGRSLCRSCARDERTLVCDGGQPTDYGTASSVVLEIVRQDAAVDEDNVSVYPQSTELIVATEQRQKLPRLFLDRVKEDAGLQVVGIEPDAATKNGVRVHFGFADGTGRDALDRLADQFERRRDQANLAVTEFAGMDEEAAADFQTGRVLAMSDALAAVRAEQGETHE